MTEMHSLGRISIWGALGGIVIFCITWLPYTYDFLFYKTTSNLNSLVITALHGICFFGLFYFLETVSWKNDQVVPTLQVLNRSAFLGWILVLGTFLVWKDLTIPFGLYVCVMSIFHYSEFLVTAIINPTALSIDSFLLNHSRQYGIAAVASWIEYAIEAYFFPGLKTYSAIMYFGLIICIVGELIRKGAMFTAWSNFTHIVQDEKAEGHELVTSGVYSLFRHPSYGGWFWWSIGTQILLMNPICTIAYALASWTFFACRIRYEEATLLIFFGQKYSEYQVNVPRTGVPFVQGYIRED